MLYVAASDENFNLLLPSSTANQRKLLAGVD